MGIATPSQTAEITAEAIVTKWIPIFGLCDNMITDNGPAFNSKLIKNICKRLQINLNNSAPYNPRANGLIEVNNKLLGTMLFSMVKDKANEWNRYLDFVIFGYNSSIHSTTKMSPNFLVFGRDLVAPVNTVFGYDHTFQNTKNWGNWDKLMRERIAERDKALNIAYMNNRAMQLKTSENSEKSLAHL